MREYRITAEANWRERLDKALAECGGRDAKILFAAGTYEVESGIHLDGACANLVFEGEEGCRLLGGRRLTNWRREDGLLKANLREAGIGDTGAFVSRGFGRPEAAGPAELFSHGRPMNLGRYPREGYLKVSAVPCGEKEGPLEEGLLFDDPTPASWKNTEEMWIMGYWLYDWACSLEKVDALDGERGFVKALPPYGSYGIGVGQRFCFWNVADEVVRPGDYYIDHKKGEAWAVPFEEDAEVAISLMDSPIFDMEGVKNVVLRGIRFEATRGTAVSMIDAEDVTVEGCSFSGMGLYAVDILLGKNCRVAGCTVCHTGDGGIRAEAGNRLTLEGCGHVIENNHIYDCSRWARVYRTPVQIGGVGITVRHNLIHDCPHTGILYWGNDMTIEYNEIYSCLLETGDAGAIYCGRNYTYRGNHVSHNYIHHLGGVGFGSMGIYNDDGLSGTVMEGNYFLECTRAVMMGGGVDYVVRHNVFVKCDPAISFDSRGTCAEMPWAKMVEGLRTSFYSVKMYYSYDGDSRREAVKKERFGENTVSAAEGVYMERYPELKKLDDLFKALPDPVPVPGQATVEENVFCAKPFFRYRWHDGEKRVYQGDTPMPRDRRLTAYVLDTRRDIIFTIDGDMCDLRWARNAHLRPDEFEDAEWGDLRVKKDSDAFRKGYRDGGFERIGLKKEARGEGDVHVLTAIFHTPGEKEARYGLRNLGTTAARGVAKVFRGEGTCTETREIAFSVEPGEEKFYSFPLTTEGDEPRLEIRSTLPGVRPARL